MIGAEVGPDIIHPKIEFCATGSLIEALRIPWRKINPYRSAPMITSIGSLLVRFGSARCRSLKCESCRKPAMLDGV